MQTVIFIHGLQSSGRGFKGRFFKKKIPNILTPDFSEFSPDISITTLLTQRMEQLSSILEAKELPIVIIGSSFGGLMGTLYTYKHPQKVRKLILLAPYLSSSLLKPENFFLNDVPVIIFHGKHDAVVSVEHSRMQAQKLFVKLEYNVVDDDHFLHNTVLALNWRKLISE